LLRDSARKDAGRESGTAALIVGPYEALYGQIPTFLKRGAG